MNLDFYFDECGVPPRVRLSTRQAMTPEIRELIGERTSGFGLSGPVGVGKTGAVAAWVMDLVRERIVTGEIKTGYQPIETGGYFKQPLALRWVSWPDKVSELRVMASQERGIESAAEIVRALSRCRYLVLDDLGAERIKGDYADDWATSQLDLILDERYNEMRPTWYTTSLTRAEFAKRYGRRMVERLAAENPLLEVPQLESRRLG